MPRTVPLWEGHEVACGIEHAVAVEGECAVTELIMVTVLDAVTACP
jgi:hypothetical protein